MRKAIVSMLAGFTALLLAGCGRSAALVNAAKVINAMVTQADVGEQINSTLGASNQTSVACGSDSFVIKDGQFTGEGTAVAAGADLYIKFRFAAYIGGFTFSDEPFLICNFHVKYAVNSDLSHLTGAGNVYSCSDFSCQWDGIIFSCADFKAALAAHPCK